MMGPRYAETAFGDYDPEPCCSCHIMPPCAFCMDFYAREKEIEEERFWQENHDPLDDDLL